MPRAQWDEEKKEEIRDKVLEFLKQSRNNLEGDSYGNSIMVEPGEMLRVTGVRSERGLNRLCNEMAAEGRIQRYVTEETGIEIYYSNSSGQPSVPWNERDDQIICAALVIEPDLSVLWAEFDNGEFPVLQFSSRGVSFVGRDRRGIAFPGRTPMDILSQLLRGEAPRE